MFDLPPLPYKYDQLEPWMDAKTVEIHYAKHHGGYVKNLNEALKEMGSNEKSLVKIIKNVTKYTEKVRNNAGGHFNHSLFFSILAPKNKGGGGKPSGELMKAIISKFGSFDSFKEEFSKLAVGIFGSGWAWLCIDKNRRLFICSTPNQDNTLMDIPENAKRKGIPILALDVWEHAYYLKYQNKRYAFISGFWEIINWKEVERRYEIALQ